ncbi:hypothetical protein [Streptomyces sp. NPDC005141]
MGDVGLQSYLRNAAELRVLSKEEQRGIETAAGEISVRPGVVAFMPISIGLLRIHELYLRSQGAQQGLALNEPVDLTLDQAAEAYLRAASAMLAQLAVLGKVQRVGLAANILRAVQELNNAAGLEFLILSCGLALNVEASAASAASDSPSSVVEDEPAPSVDASLWSQVLKRLLEKNPAIWDLGHGGRASIAHPVVSLAARSRSVSASVQFVEQVSLVLDPATLSIRALPAREVTELVSTSVLGNPADLRIQVGALQEVQLTKDLSAVMNDRCEAIWTLGGAIIGATAGAVIGGLVGGPLGAGAGAVAGADLGANIGEAIGKLACSDGVGCGGSSTAPSTPSGSDGPGTPNGDGSPSDSGNGDDGSSDGNRGDGAATTEQTPAPESRPPDHVMLVETPSWLEGAGVTAFMVKQAGAVTLSGLPQLADDLTHLSTLGVLATLPEFAQRDLKLDIGRLNDIAKQIDRSQIVLR